jgi:hypothetical protein
VWVEPTPAPTAADRYTAHSAFVFRIEIANFRVAGVVVWCLHYPHSHQLHRQRQRCVQLSLQPSTDTPTHKCNNKQARVFALVSPHAHSLVSCPLRATVWFSAACGDDDDDACRGAHSDACLSA